MLIDKHKLIEFLADVACGTYTEKIVTPSFETNVQRSAEVKDRMKAIEMLADRAYGKPTQVMDVSSQGRFVIMRAKR